MKAFVLASAVIAMNCSELQGQTTAKKSASPRAAGSIEGDVFLLMKSGDLRKGAGVEVFLIKPNNFTYGGVNAACDAGGGSLGRDLGIALKKSVVASTTADINAHYRFGSVQPGRYIVFSAWDIGPTGYHWFESVLVGRSSTILTLDQSKAFDDTADICLKLKLYEAEVSLDSAKKANGKGK